MFTERSPCVDAGRETPYDRKSACGECSEDGAVSSQGAGGWLAL